MSDDKGIKDILNKYESKLSGELNETEDVVKAVSREYELFRGEVTKEVSGRYERWCNWAGKIIKINPSKKDEIKIQESIDAAHLRITPSGATALAVLIGILGVLIGLFYGLVSFFVFNKLSIFIPAFFILTSVILVIPLTKLPNYFANRWRLKASNQMVLCILYVVMYMRHTSNLEHAIRFAAQYINPPLSLDLRKIFWDIETGKYKTIRQSLDNYLEGWRDYNSEFIESFHLIESSLYEPTESRRLQLLDKSLDVMLDGTYERMLHYAHDLKNPITMLHMLGVVLPILGLVIFPLISSFMGGIVKWYHLGVLYNIILPAIVLIIGVNILSKRPTGYGESQISLNDPRYKEDYKINPKWIAAFIICVLLLIGFLPLIFFFIDPSFEIQLGNTKMFDNKQFGEGIWQGPYGLGALIMSLFIPLGLALGIGYYYKARTKNLMKMRNDSIKLEKEFSGSLFQLGNRIGEGMPAELAFGKVAQNMSGTVTGNFFAKVNNNVMRLGTSLREALFNSKIGAIYSFPSNVVEGSMKVLLESAKRGPKVASKSIISVSQYINQIHKINERLKDLLADIVSSMKGQITFLTPIIAGIVVGIGSMITNIIGLLGDQLSSVTSDVAGGESVGPAISPALISVFNIKDVIPTYYFQLVVGLYVVQITIILAMLANGIDNGVDKVGEKYIIGKSLYIGVGLYFIIALVVTLVFNTLAAGILLAGFGG